MVVPVGNVAEVPAWMPAMFPARSTIEEPPRPLSQPPPQRLVLDQASERGLERHLVLDWDEEAAPLGLDDLDEAAHAGGDDGEPERHRLDHDEAERLVARRETEDVGVRVRLHQRLVGQPSSEGHARHDLGIAGELAPEDGSIGFSQLRVLGVLAIAVATEHAVFSGDVPVHANVEVVVGLNLLPLRAMPKSSGVKAPLSNRTNEW